MGHHHTTDHAPHEHTTHEHTGHGPAMSRTCDVAVIGGSAAGLAGALQLARQRRSVIVVDDGTPRNAPAEHMHGYLGRESAPPAELVAIGRDEVRSYGGEVLTGRVLDVRREGDRFRVALTGGSALLARRVLVASGIVDELPDIPGLRERWGREVIHCPFCHGWEVRDQRVVQIVTTPMGLHPTPLVRHLTDRLTVVVHDAAGIDPAALRSLTASGVAVLQTPVRSITDADGALGVDLADGTRLPADAVLVGSRFHARLDMLAGLGLEATAHPSGLGEALGVDATGATAVAGVYAAGNVADPSLQVLPAAANGSMVGAHLAFSLANEDLAAGVRPSAVEAEWDARYGDERVWSSNPNGSLVAEVTDLTPGRALDVGTGEGADALWLAERGWTVTATDVSSRALGRLDDEAARRGVQVRTLHVDANGIRPYGEDRFDLVSLQYGSFTRTPDGRGLRNLVDAVAPGGTLLVVAHDMAWAYEELDPAETTRLFDPAAFVGVAHIAEALAADGGWRLDVHETRPRPAGAISHNHVEDVVLRAVRVG
ncbi:bifunctional NAD(P)/FAD-dependent oxidoreductase/class I SAM-dependent methyltransferase [Microbacterium sp. SSW1-59]|uniref:bifunctional NAD(P)/FAD-dependent oxidoreductase/class I SAM-dependent methyltransferase n=1 Tax=Microbacterium xanthum TaxID=3079794 RepID=UPI002AD239C3|nr:bifunctional NAD(P)/FAD-dependent oxidoreductase/class I SAM-dependent methyltransferase [Microbacterium sp. SSW1-59]MDZ8201222.1 bifunctional NAD(P)/FAD-dependent oxidoreductase/class I SAM-dependent methyltransferase [Microbacterium sp. SSW1-59]